jgi:hypothetical protein
MNTSILRRLFLSDMPVWKLRIPDYLGLGFLLLVPELVWRNPKAWYSWGGALAIGVVFLWAGDAIPIAWKRLLAWWPWNKFHAKDAELAKVLQDNSALRVKSGLDKSSHNVQFVGFKFIHDEPFRIATLGFQNVPNAGKPIGKFKRPRLRVIYYEYSTGQEIEDMYSVQWWDEKDGIDDISAKGRNAVVASYFEGKWRIIEGDEHPITNLDLDSPPYEPRSVELPFGETRIIAILSCNYNDSPVVTTTGMLTLGEDGSASFKPIKAI